MASGAAAGAGSSASNLPNICHVVVFHDTENVPLDAARSGVDVYNAVIRSALSATVGEAAAERQDLARLHIEYYLPHCPTKHGVRPIR